MTADFFLSKVIWNWQNTIEII